MSNKAYIGFDPGKNGAMAVLYMGEIFFHSIQILDIARRGNDIDCQCLKSQLSCVEEQLGCVVIEKTYYPTNRPEIHRKLDVLHKDMWMIYTVCQLLELPTEIVPAQTWKSKVLGRGWRGNWNAPIEFVKSKWPDIDLKRTPRCKKDWIDGACAVCLAYYGKLIAEK